MFLTRRPVIMTILFILLIIAGFFYLLRGCLSAYDERSALAPALYVEKDGKGLVFSIVKFEKATSYTQRGGFTTKSVSTNYYIQTNDVATGEKLASKKIKHQRDIKSHPVEAIGVAGGLAWVFIGELMAFDPFTLEEKVSTASMEKNNPAIKGKLPPERRFYAYDRDNHTFVITITDGSRWLLDPATLAMGPVAEQDYDDRKKNAQIAQLEKAMKQNQVETDSLFEQKMRRPSRMLSAKEISVQQYHKMINEFNDERSKLYRVRDSLRRLLTQAEKLQRGDDDVQRKIESLRSRTGINFSQIKVNSHLLNDKWYGLYTRQEMEKLNDRYRSDAVYGDAARRQLYTSSYKTEADGDIIIDKANAGAVANNFFLDGGFLLDKRTGMPVRLSPGLLIVHKDVIGTEGKIQVSLVDTSGTTLWTHASGLKEWVDWIVTEKYLILLGSDNKELSGGDCNVLRCINLVTGQASSYDFFTDKS